jgi:hypothetical protein
MLAVQLSNEDENEVIERLLSEYASNTFTRAAKSLTVKKEATQSEYIDNIDFGKAIRKIPTWAYKPSQNNHRLIKAFLLIQEEQDKVQLEELIIRCTDKDNYPDTYVSDFKGNFAQMKTDAGNSHGKVFVVENDEVQIWSEVEAVLNEYAERFKGDGTMTLMDVIDNQDSGRKTITSDMTKEAYEISKMVYNGKISRTKGKELIAEKTGMVAGSAQDYITDFLAMMNGERYTRTLNLFATEYYMKSIKADYGKESFIKALEACQKHVEYYNKLGYGKQVKTQELIDRLRDEEK